jgi:hypothetical protein
MIRICQCLCGPARHCILAVLYDPATKVEGLDPVEQLREAVIVAVRSKAIDPWCLLCRAPHSAWVYEDQPTMFHTMKRAEGAARKLEAEMAKLREFIKAGKN